MSNNQHHIIHKEILDFILPEQKTAYKMQDKIREIVQNWLMRNESIFDDFSKSGEIIEVDGLEIDLGDIPENDLQRTIESQLDQKFRTALGNKVSSIRYSTINEAHQPAGSLKTIEEKNSDVFIQFLRTGNIHIDYNPLELVTKISEIKNETEVQRLKQTLAYWPAQVRIIRQFKEETIKVLWKKMKYTEWTPSILSNIKKELNKMSFDAPKSIKLTEKNIISALLKHLELSFSKVSKLQHEAELNQFVIRFARQYFIQPNDVKKALYVISSVVKQKISPSMINIMDTVKKQYADVLDSSSGEPIKNKENSRVLDDKHKIEETHLSHQKEPIENKENGRVDDKHKIEETPLSHQKEPIEEQKMAVNNAGLVLLWPYLKIYLEALQMVENGEFSDHEQKQKAVNVLHYLVTGEVSAFEHVVALNKVLCGMQTNNPISDQIEISQLIKDESEQLLETVIEQWKAIGSTSVEGLRKTFLQREGLLYDKDDHWLLVVEKVTLDILLEKIPWGFSTIHLSWMDKPLIVNWV